MFYVGSMGDVWIGRYHSPVPIRCRGALHFYSARDAESDRLRVVVMAPGVPAHERRAYLAKEVAAGAPPTPGADVCAITVFLRSGMAFVEMPPLARRVFAGHSLVGDAKAVLLLVWSNMKILAASPKARPDMEPALAVAQKMWRLFDFEPDVSGFSAWVARAIASDAERLADAPQREETPRIRLGLEGEWLETPNGMRHALGARRPLRRLLVALAEARRDRTGAALTIDELLQAGWPGENPLPEAGNGGYRLDPAVLCQF